MWAIKASTVLAGQAAPLSPLPLARTWRMSESKERRLQEMAAVAWMTRPRWPALPQVMQWALFVWRPPGGRCWLWLTRDEDAYRISHRSGPCKLMEGNNDYDNMDAGATRSLLLPGQLCLPLP
ncbi:hypothetical protein BS78_05G283800 [Paspalum vaginatum]|nr:hypothetical protein BS78_05G283800 [Paspalum vaginatum]KAJ1277291.1 hypothetical protein BS78_05G283800 [Paspalum vaginatum]